MVDLRRGLKRELFVGEIDVDYRFDRASDIAAKNVLDLHEGSPLGTMSAR